MEVVVGGKEVDIDSVFSDADSRARRVADPLLARGLTRHGESRPEQHPLVALKDLQRSSVELLATRVAYIDEVHDRIDITNWSTLPGRWRGMT